MPSPQIHYEERFRTPLAHERALGLWVDRIGRKSGDRGTPASLRVLGQYAVVAVDAGEGELESLAGGRHSVAAGDVWFLLAADAARYWPHGAWDTRWIVWNGDANGALVQLGCLSPTRLLCRGGRPMVTRAWDRLHELMPRQDTAAVLERQIVILELVHALYLRQGTPGGAGTDAAGRLVQTALDRLNGPDGLTLAIDALARELRISPAHFRRLFRQRTGGNPKTVQTALRITRAKELLAAGHSLKDSAELLGFTDVFHFMRVFRKVTGQTAGQFQAQG